MDIGPPADTSSPRLTCTTRYEDLLRRQLSLTELRRGDNSKRLFRSKDSDLTASTDGKSHNSGVGGHQSERRVKSCYQQDKRPKRFGKNSDPLSTVSNTPIRTSSSHTNSVHPITTVTPSGSVNVESSPRLLSAGNSYTSSRRFDSSHTSSRPFDSSHTSSRRTTSTRETLPSSRAWSYRRLQQQSNSKMATQNDAVQLVQGSTSGESGNSDDVGVSTSTNHGFQSDIQPAATGGTTTSVASAEDTPTTNVSANGNGSGVDAEARSITENLGQRGDEDLSGNGGDIAVGDAVHTSGTNKCKNEDECHGMEYGEGHGRDHIRGHIGSQDGDGVGRDRGHGGDGGGHREDHDEGRERSQSGGQIDDERKIDKPLSEARRQDMEDVQDYLELLDHKRGILERRASAEHLRMTDVPTESLRRVNSSRVSLATPPSNHDAVAVSKRLEERSGHAGGPPSSSSLGATQTSAPPGLPSTSKPTETTSSTTASGSSILKNTGNRFSGGGGDTVSMKAEDRRESGSSGSAYTSAEETSRESGPQSKSESDATAASKSSPTKESGGLQSLWMKDGEKVGLNAPLSRHIPAPPGASVPAAVIPSGTCHASQSCLTSTPSSTPSSAYSALSSRHQRQPHQYESPSGSAAAAMSSAASAMSSAPSATSPQYSSPQYSTPQHHSTLTGTLESILSRSSVRGLPGVMSENVASSPLLRSPLTTARSTPLYQSVGSSATLRPSFAPRSAALVVTSSRAEELLRIQELEKFVCTLKKDLADKDLEAQTLKRELSGVGRMGSRGSDESTGGARSDLEKKNLLREMAEAEKSREEAIKEKENAIGELRTLQRRMALLVPSAAVAADGQQPFLPAGEAGDLREQLLVVRHTNKSLEGQVHEFEETNLRLQATLDRQANEISRLRQRNNANMSSTSVESSDDCFRMEIRQLRSDLRGLRERNHHLSEENIQLREKLRDFTVHDSSFSPSDLAVSDSPAHTSMNTSSREANSREKLTDRTPARSHELAFPKRDIIQGEVDVTARSRSNDRIAVESPSGSRRYPHQNKVGTVNGYHNDVSGRHGDTNGYHISANGYYDDSRTHQADQRSMNVPSSVALEEPRRGGEDSRHYGYTHHEALGTQRVDCGGESRTREVEEVRRYSDRRSYSPDAANSLASTNRSPRLRRSRLSPERLWPSSPLLTSGISARRGRTTSPTYSDDTAILVSTYACEPTVTSAFSSVGRDRTLTDYETRNSMHRQSADLRSEITANILEEAEMSLSKNRGALLTPKSSSAGSSCLLAEYFPGEDFLEETPLTSRYRSNSRYRSTSRSSGESSRREALGLDSEEENGLLMCSLPPSSSQGKIGLRSVVKSPTITQHNKTKLLKTKVSPSRLTASGKRPFAPRTIGDLTAGDVVKYARESGRITQGTIKYIGTLHNQSGPTVGVEMVNADSTHNGMHDGVQYFQCKSNKGAFIKFEKIILAWGD